VTLITALRAYERATHTPAIPATLEMNPNTASNIKSVTKIRPTILSQRMPALDGFDETASLIKRTSYVPASCVFFITALP
jgi:hypothetical protein